MPRSNWKFVALLILIALSASAIGGVSGVTSNGTVAKLAAPKSAKLLAKASSSSALPADATSGVYMGEFDAFGFGSQKIWCDVMPGGGYGIAFTTWNGWFCYGRAYIGKVDGTHRYLSGMVAVRDDTKRFFPSRGQYRYLTTVSEAGGAVRYPTLNGITTPTDATTVVWGSGGGSTSGAPMGTRSVFGGSSAEVWCDVVPGGYYGVAFTAPGAAKSFCYARAFVNEGAGNCSYQGGVMWMPPSGESVFVGRGPAYTTSRRYAANGSTGSYTSPTGAACAGGVATGPPPVPKPGGSGGNGGSGGSGSGNGGNGGNGGGTNPCEGCGAGGDETDPIVPPPAPKPTYKFAPRKVEISTKSGAAFKVVADSRSSYRPTGRYVNFRRYVDVHRCGGENGCVNISPILYTGPAPSIQVGKTGKVTVILKSSRATGFGLRPSIIVTFIASNQAFLVSDYALGVSSIFASSPIGSECRPGKPC